MAGAVVGRSSLLVYRGWVRLRSKVFSVLAGGAFARFGTRSTIELPVRLSGERWISVGEDVYVGSGCWLQVIGEPRTVAIEIGDGTSIAGGCVLSAVSSIKLGRRVLLARNVYVADHRHAFEDPSRAILDQGVEQVEPVEIGDGAWLGQNVVVGPGVNIGVGAVVGANSVVNADVPAYSVAVGAPARVVRSFAPSPATVR